jgi:CDP-diacylglycerol--glycerol-3-phosphate 3-phosphatidyltransferase
MEIANGSRQMKPEFNFPNTITAARILLTPLFIWLMMSDNGVEVQLSAVIFLLAAISDWYDGWAARRYNAMSSFGRFFDPLADKILIGAAFFAFVHLGLFSLWMVLIVVGRDILVTLLRVVADLKHQPVVTSRLAKWKTALQLIFLWYVVAVFTLKNVAWLRQEMTAATFDAFLSPWIINISMLLLTALSLITAVQYAIENRHTIRILTNGNLARTTP